MAIRMGHVLPVNMDIMVIYAIRDVPNTVKAYLQAYPLVFRLADTVTLVVYLATMVLCVTSPAVETVKVTFVIRAQVHA